MATIKIQRTSEYNNRLRDYHIFIDGKKVGTIANGAAKEFSVAPGSHIITTKIDWCSSQEVTFHIEEGEQKEMKVGGFKNGSWLMPVTGGLLVLHFLLSVILHINYTIILVLPVFFLMLYYITIGRKKYLTLTEIG